MSEYWVSHKKYFCKYCNIYIADDVPSRRQHEGGLRHKGNVERFVRGLYKTGEKRKQDLEEEKREMARVEIAAQAAFAQDVGAGLVKPGSSSAAPVAPVAGPSKPARSSDPYANYSTAASLGFTDPDEERRKAEAELRSKEGVIGAWEVVAVMEHQPAENGEEADVVHGAGDGGQAAADREQERKRQADAPVDDDDIRPWKLTKKTAASVLGDNYDPADIPIKLKPKKQETAVASLDPPPGSSSSTASGDSQTATSLPKWSAKGWNRPGAAPPFEGEKPLDIEALGQTKQDVLPEEPTDIPNAPREERANTSQIKLEHTAVKAEEGIAEIKAEQTETSAAPATGSLFRKRKAPGGAGAPRGRR